MSLDNLFDEIMIKVENAFAETVNDYNQEVDATIESMNAFADLGFEGQDIVDTGRLLESKKVDTDKTKTSVSAAFSWNPTSPKNGEKYASKVWAGFFAFGGPKFIRGRHWPERAATNMGVTETFVHYLNEQDVEAEIIIDGDDDLDD